jgi:hypothetical protein
MVDDCCLCVVGSGGRTGYARYSTAATYAPRDGRTILMKNRLDEHRIVTPIAGAIKSHGLATMPTTHFFARGISEIK